MKRLFVQTFKRLPAYGSKIFVVKETGHSNSIKKVLLIYEFIELF